MSYFEQEADKNLQYDDAAFVYFLASLAIGSIITLSVLLYKEYANHHIPNENKLSNTIIFKEQVANTKQMQRIITKSFIFKTVLLLISILSLLLLSNFIKLNANTLKSFNPYEILGVTQHATLKEIKKAYRLLAMEFHPDKNFGDPEAHAKFILISKSYECFANDEKRSNCFKYGNPDGVNAFKIGIGLPKFFINTDSQMYVLPLVLAIFLILIPKYMINWNNKLKTEDEHGLSVQSYPGILSYFNQNFNTEACFYILASLKELYEDKQLGTITAENKRWLEALEINNRIFFNPNLLDKLNQEQLNIIFRLVKHMTRNAQDQFDLQFIHKVESYLNKIVHFAVPFCSKMSDQKILMDNQQWTVNFLGVDALMILIDFTTKFYGARLKKSEMVAFTPFELNIALTKEELEISLKNKINNVTYQQYLLSEGLIDQHLLAFPGDRRPHLKQQINNLPVLKLQMKFKVAEKQVTQLLTTDYGEVWFRISKLKTTTGHCYLQNYPFLKKERFYFIFVFEKNLIHFRQITFSEGKDVFIGKFSYRQDFQKNVTFIGAVISDCYDQCAIQENITIQVVYPPPEIENAKVIFHRDDLQIQKLPKNFLEELKAVQEDPEQNQLSDDQEQEQEEEKQFKKGNENHQ